MRRGPGESIAACVPPVSPCGRSTSRRVYPASRPIDGWPKARCSMGSSAPPAAGFWAAQRRPGEVNSPLRQRLAFLSAGVYPARRALDERPTETDYERLNAASRLFSGRLSAARRRFLGGSAPPWQGQLVATSGRGLFPRRGVYPAMSRESGAPRRGFILAAALAR